MKKSSLAAKFPNLALLSAMALMFSSGLANAAPIIQVPTGSACEAINDAIKALPKTGGMVVIGTGTFICSKPIVIDRDNVIVTGMGREQTLLKAAPLKALPIVVIGSVHNIKEEDKDSPGPDREVHDIGLHNLTIDGDVHSNTKYMAETKKGSLECWDNEAGISLSCETDAGSYIRNNGLTIRRAVDINVSNIETREAYSGGITIEKWNKNIRIDNFISRKNYFDGFAGYATKDSKFTNFIVSDNDFSGISVDWGFEWNEFSNGLLENNRDNGVFASDTGHNIYRNLTANNNVHMGFYLSGAYDPKLDADGKMVMMKNGKDAVMIPRVDSCDGNSIIGFKGSGNLNGIMINSPCLRTMVANADIPDSREKCIIAYPGAAISTVGSTCGNPAQKMKVEFFRLAE